MPTYTPNYKFKASGAEHEIPEFLRQHIKDKESERYMHELFEKAYGLPSLKNKFKEQQSEYHGLQKNHQEIIGQIEEARTAYKRNDLDTMFEIFAVNPEKVLQWAVEKVQLSQMPQEQRQLLEAKQASERRAYQLEKQHSQMSQESMQQQGQYLSQMLDLALERQDYAAIAQAYDSRKAKSGAFRELVVNMGRSEFALTGKSITPLEAIQKAMELLGEMPSSAKPQEMMQQGTQTATPANQAPSEKKVIPNLANAGAKSGSAPAKSKFKSLDDLKKRHQEMMGQ